MFRRAVGSLLARRFSPRALPRATPRTAPARSLHSLRDLLIGDGAAGVVAAAFAAGFGGTVAVQYFMNDESAARKKPPKPLKVSEEEMKPRFEDWMKRNNKTYRDEKEKAMRFEVFKATVRWIESLPPSSQEKVLPENCFADLRKEELPGYRSCIKVNGTNSDNDAKFLAEYEKAARKDEDMMVRFEDWMKKYKTYRDGEEMAMRFQLFKAAVKRIESQPPPYQEQLQIGYFADFKEEEHLACRSCVDSDDTGSEVYCENEKGEPQVCKPAMKQGDMRATQASA